MPSAIVLLKSGRNGLCTLHYFRQLFYWMVEETPAGWTDEGLAFSLDSMIKRMHKYLTREKLPHYMIYKRNTFDGLPKHKIRQAQEKFHRLQENLVWDSNHFEAEEGTPYKQSSLCISELKGGP